MFGGFIAGYSSATVHSLELNRGTWTEETGLPVVVCFPEVAKVQNNIFLFDVETNQLLKMGARTKRWSYRTKLPKERCWGVRMISHDTKLLVAGGNRRICAEYDPKTDEWCLLTSPSLEHHLGALVACGENVYLIGGGGEDRIEEYNVQTKTWAICAQKVPKKLRCLHALVLEKKADVGVVTSSSCSSISTQV